MKMEGTSAAMDGRSQAYMDVLVAVPGIFMPKTDCDKYSMRQSVNSNIDA